MDVYFSQIKAFFIRFILRDFMFVIPVKSKTGIIFISTNPIHENPCPGDLKWLIAIFFICTARHGKR